MASIKKLLRLCGSRSFVLNLPQAANAGKSVFVYGPSGLALKNNILSEWWHSVVTTNSDVCGIDGDTAFSVTKAIPIIAKSCGLQIPFGLAQLSRQCNSDPMHVSREQPKVERAELLVNSPSTLANVVFLCCQEDQRRWLSHWQKNRLRWWRKFSRNPERFNLVEGSNEQKYHNSIKCEFPWGMEVMETFNVSHERELHKELGVEVPVTSTTMTADIDRAVLAYLHDTYSETNIHSTVLKLHLSLAPYKLAVLPTDGANSRLCMYSKMLADELNRANVITDFSHNGPLSNRLAVQDELGTPYRVIADSSTLENGIVTLQDRDTTMEEDMNGKDVLPSLQRMLFGARIN